MHGVRSLTDNPRILLVGHGRSGKDTAGEYLEKITGLKFGGSTSRWLAPYVAERMGMDVEQCYAVRHQNREIWYRIGQEVREHQPGILLDTAFRHGPITAGVRDKVELQYACEKQLITHLIWIQRDVPVDPTLEFNQFDCVRYVGGKNVCYSLIFNNKDLDVFRNNLDQLAHHNGWLISKT